MVMFTFSVFNWNYPFKANLVQIIFKIVNLSRNLVPRQKSMVKSKINMQKLVELFILFVLDRKHPFWANLVQKNQNSQFKLKFGTQTNSNTQNLIVVFTFLFQNGNTHFDKQAAAVNSAFLFCCGECVRGLFLGTALKNFK